MPFVFCSVTATEILDSRGRPTLCVILQLGDDTLMQLADLMPGTPYGLRPR